MLGGVAVVFTGIVDHCGTIESAEKGRLWIRSRFLNLALGESVAVDGICLTVAESRDSTFLTEISPETLGRTTASSYRDGDEVHLERALRVGDRLGGHWVTGHVDETATLLARHRINDCLFLTLGQFSERARELVIEKGSVAIQGISLTVNSISIDTFDLMLIPHTLERTCLGRTEVGAKVNVEWDWMAKLVHNAVEHLSKRLLGESFRGGIPYDKSGLTVRT